MGGSASSQIIELHLKPKVPEKVQSEFLLVIIQHILLDDAKKAATDLFTKLLPVLVGSGELAHWSLWVEVLHDRLEKGWDSVQTAIVGSLAARNSNVLAQLVRDLFRADISKEAQEDLRRSLNAITNAIKEAIESKTASSVVYALIETPIDTIPSNRFYTVATLLREFAENKVDNNFQDSLAIWSLSKAKEFPVELIPAISQLIINSSTTTQHLFENELEQIIPNLQETQFTQIIKKLRFVPQHLTNSLEKTVYDKNKKLAKSSKLALITIYSTYINNNYISQEAIFRIIQLSKDEFDDVASAASKELVKIAGKQERPLVADLLSLISSHIAGLRENGLKALSKIVEHGMTMTEQDIITVSQQLDKETKQQVIQCFCELVEQWVEKNKYASPSIIDSVGSIVTRVSQSYEKFDKGYAFAVLKALKKIANLEELLDESSRQKLAQWSQIFLQEINKNKTAPNERWITGLFKKIAKFDKNFLETVVIELERDYQNKLHIEKSNVIAVLTAIFEVQTRRSELFKSILKSSHFPEEIKHIVIQRYRIL